MSTDLVAPTRRRCAISAPAAQSDIFNCGYRAGYSVLEVIDAVKRVSGRDFKAIHARAGPATPRHRRRLGANHGPLGWQPEYDDLDTIVGHALAWEQGLDRLKEAS